VRDEAEKRGIGWAYWEFASSFGVYSPKTGNWIEPLRSALFD
jgi:endoglucanase